MTPEELERLLRELEAQVDRNEQLLLRHADRHADQAAPDPLAITTSAHARQHAYDSTSDHSGTLAWTKLSKAGSDLADLATTVHEHTGAGVGGALTDDEHLGFSQWVEISTPANPAVDKLRVFARASGNNIELIARSSQGAEAVLARLSDAVPPATKPLMMMGVKT